MTTDYSAKIRDHLTQQRKQASTPGGTCCYRINRDGRTLMCAVGCLIPDDKYHPDFEGLIIDPVAMYRDPGRVQTRKQLGAALPADLDIKMARQWQHYHDGSVLVGPTEFNYVEWCDNDMPANSPAAFYEALKIHMAPH